MAVPSSATAKPSTFVDKTGPQFDLRGDPRMMLKIGATFAGIVAAVAATVYLVLSFVNEARDRDIQAWQVRLGIIADSRASVVEAWIARQHNTLEGLADNQALKLYFTRLNIDQRSGAGTQPAEAQYLGTLLTVTAARTGFQARAIGPDARANVPRTGVAGLALMDMAGRTLVSTGHFPPIESDLRTFIGRLPRGKSAFFGPFRAPSGKVSIAFVRPIFGIQHNRQIGIVLGIKPVATELYPLLKQPGLPGGTQETILIRRQGSVITYLSPLADGTKPLARSLAQNTPKLAAAFAIANPGDFAIRRDYAGTDVLVTSRALKTAPWVLVHKINRDEALGPSDSRARRMLIFLLLGVVIVGAAILGLWRHGASRRATAAAAKFRDMADRFEHQRNFLSLLTDAQPNAIFIADAATRVQFANAEAARRSGMQSADMIGKPLDTILGPLRAKVLQRLNREAAEEGRQIADVHRVEVDGEEMVYQTKHIPLALERDLPRGVLVVEEDVTAAVTEREGRMKSLRALVGTLVAVVDRRDPNAAHHSARTAFIARAVAEEIGLDQDHCEAAEYAGQLMNLGKILVPEEILTKQGSLTADEMRQVHEGIQATADLLEGVAFDGPVVKTLRQVQAHWDGSGYPEGLKGADILVSARIVAVANAFVALTSQRAHRDGVSVDEAIETLLAGVGKVHDRKIVAALINFLDNHGGRERWAAFKPDKPGKSAKRARAAKRPADSDEGLAG
ncbi:MAG: cache domain-containing protein [Alphaproteobacteria bacterium]|nr:cache domain-containing protein [Alphaproteobacteria bacterium]